MATICDRCGNESYVTYVKLNPSKICDECEDQERRTNGMLNDWTLIKENNRKRYQRRKERTQFKNVVCLNSYRQLFMNRKFNSRMIVNKKG